MGQCEFADGTNWNKNFDNSIRAWLETVIRAVLEASSKSAMHASILSN